MTFDSGSAKELVASAYGVIGLIVVGILTLWYRIAKGRKNIGIEDGERVRFADAIEDARVARKEAHEANNVAMAMQRDMGRLEAENKECNKRADRQDVEIAELKAENKAQAVEIAGLRTDLRRLMRIDQLRSEIGGGLK